MKKIVLLSFFGVWCGSALGQVTANQPDPIILCDINNPGDQVEEFDLTIREPQILGSQNNVVVTYHLTSGDALGNGGFIETPESFFNTSDPQNIFIRVENINNANDWEITVMELIVPFIPEIMTAAQDIIEEDPDGDGFAVFDLTRDESDVLGSQDPFEFNISYYETQADADANTNPIAFPEDYTNTINPQTIYTRFAPLQDQCQYESYSFQIIADETLSIEEAIRSKFSLYPNPARNKITLDTSGFPTISSVAIVSLTGRVVITIPIDSESTTHQLPIDKLSKGIYFLRITSEGKQQHKKFIKI